MTTEDKLNVLRKEKEIKIDRLKSLLKESDALEKDIEEIKESIEKILMFELSKLYDRNNVSV